MSSAEQRVPSVDELRSRVSDLEERERKLPVLSVPISIARGALALRIGKIFIFARYSLGVTGVLGVTDEFSIKVDGLTLRYEQRGLSDGFCAVTWTVASGVGEMQIELHVGEQVLLSTRDATKPEGRYFIRAFATRQEADDYASSQQ